MVMVKKLLIFGIGFLLSTISHASDVVYQLNGKQYEGYLLNHGKRSPTIFLIHDWDGLTEYEKRRSNMLFKQGYSVFAIDLFGKGVRPEKDVDRRQHTGELYKDRVKLRRLLKGAISFAKSKGVRIDHAVAAGYCFGGAAVLELARSGENLKGFITFHGGLSTPEGQDYSKTKGEILVFHGSADSHITMTDFASLAEILEKSNVKHELVSYGGAPHSFTVFGSDRYRKDTDEKSWEHFLKFLNRVLKS